MWFYDNWSKRNSSMTYKLLTAFNIMIFVLGAFVTVAGVSSLFCGPLSISYRVLTPHFRFQTYGSVTDIKIGYEANGGTRPWSCADNSNST